MPNIQPILFPVDFSERCCRTVPFVESMANRYHAKVTLLSVVQPLYFAAADGPPIPVDTDALLEDIQSKLDGSFVRNFVGLTVERVAALGDPAQEIVNFARAQSAGLIMMPSHGYGPFRRLLLGSVTAKVLHDAACPVWTSAHMAQPPFSDHLKCRTVLCAVDGTPSSVSLMKWASELATDFGAELRLVHVIPGMSGVPSGRMDREFEKEAWKNAVDAIESLQKSAGVKAPLRGHRRRGRQHLR